MPCPRATRPDKFTATDAEQAIADAERFAATLDADLHVSGLAVFGSVAALLGGADTSSHM